MGRRVVVALIAIVIAAVGTFFIWQWVSNFEEGVEAQFETVDVYVAVAPISQNTPAEDLDQLIELRGVVRESVVPGAVTDLGTIAGQVTTIDIFAGEQLTQQRFGDPSEIFEEFQREEAPPGTLEVTFSLPEERLLGGQIRPGDSVAFIGSFEPLTVDTDFREPGADDGLEDIVAPGEEPADNPDTPADESLVQTPNVTSTVVHKVFVTNLQYADPPETVDEEGNPIAEDPRLVPNTQFYITLAAPINEVEKMVFVREFGLVWLALETEDDPEDASTIVTRANIFAD